MRQVLLGTDTLSYFLKGVPEVVAKAEAYSADFDEIGISIISFYEIIRGLKAKDAQKQLEVFLEFAKENHVYPLTENSVQLSAQLFSELRKAGTPVDDLDLLIAGIAIENGLT